MDKRGYFSGFGGCFIPEILTQTFEELIQAYEAAKADPGFWQEYLDVMSTYSCRPTPLTFAENLTNHFGGARIYIKREDLNHTGAHKANNVMGQGLLVKRMGKTRVIAETGAGQHGVATATVAARYGLECDVFMGNEDIRRQSLNVFRMKLLGARVHGVSSGTATLKDAMNDALRYWVTHVRDTFYVIGTVAGPHPYPMMVRDFQSVIGREARQQLLEQTGRLPDAALACIGGGSNAMGLFYPFIADSQVRLIGVEAAGLGLDSGKHAASISAGAVGVLHGNKTFLLQNADGQIEHAHSISAGLDYPGVGPEHALLHTLGRGEYVAISDAQALEGFKLLTRMEGIIPALESAHAIAYLAELAPQMRQDQSILVCLSGRGDKDMHTVAEAFGVSL